MKTRERIASITLRMLLHNISERTEGANIPLSFSPHFHFIRCFVEADGLSLVTELHKMQKATAKKRNISL